MLKDSFKIACSALTDVGLVREHNEDAFRIFPEEGIFILADGMGGHNAGEVAADISVSTLTELLLDQSEKITLKEAFKKVNRLIFQMGEETPTLSGMGTTLICLSLHEGPLCAHVGDSRLYLFRSGKLVQVTQDHSLLNELISLGTITREEGEQFPYKHILSKTIGTSATVEPEINPLTLQAGDLFLLCSDGLTNYATAREIESVLRQMENLDEGVTSLVERAKLNGGGDNITVILVRIDDLPR